MSVKSAWVGSIAGYLDTSFKAKKLRIDFSFNCIIETIRIFHEIVLKSNFREQKRDLIGISQFIHLWVFFCKADVSCSAFCNSLSL